MYGQSPWDEAGDAATGFGNNIARAAMASAAMRQRQQQFMAQMAMRNAMLELQRQRAQAGMALDTEKALTEKSNRQAGESLAKHVGQFGKAERLAQRFNHPELVDMVVGRLMQDQARLAGQNPSNVSVQVPRILEQRNPRMRQLMATDTPMQQVVQPGATLFNNLTGKPVYTSPMSPYQERSLDLRRQTAEDMQRTREANTSLGAAKVLGSPDAILFNDETRQFLESLMHREIPASTNDVQSTQPQAQTQTDTSVAGETVRVINPQGKAVRIPADQLQEALGAGYRLNQ